VKHIKLNTTDGAFYFTFSLPLSLATNDYSIYWT